jgi:prepilin-type N-terminal cleavage/methylation domain-containing protein
MRNLISNRRNAMEQAKSSKGFTLIEMAIVILIVGLAVAALMPVYSIYVNQQRTSATTSHVNAAISAIGNFRSLKGRYPCPASLTIDRTDANYGRENCSDLTPTAVGSCNNGICVEQSKRAAIAYQYPFGTARNQPPRVLVGTIPFRQLNLDEDEAYDGYRNRLMYVVTEHLICDTCFAADGGGIDIVNDSGNTALDAMGTAHFVVFSYGEDSAGAFNTAGIRNPCGAVGTVENENCDFDASPAAADATYQIARGSGSDAANNFDDVLNYFTQDEIPLWQMSTAQPFAIHQKPNGAVGIGMTPSALNPAIVQVQSDVRVTNQVDAGGVPIPGTGEFRVGNICSQDGSGCFPTSKIAGPVPSVDVNDGLECPMDDPDGTGQFMVGVNNGRPDCRDQLTAECPSGQLMTGINPDGSLRCSARPCAASSVNECSVSNALPAAAHGAWYQVNTGASRSRWFLCNDGSWVGQGSWAGSCTCTPGVISTVTTACGTGWTGNQTTTTTRVCPAGTTTTTTNRSGCVCDPIYQNGTRACPPGHSGIIQTRRNWICPTGYWGSYYDLAGGNSCSCTNSTETRTVPCGTGLTGNIPQSRTVTCTVTGVTYGTWTNTQPPSAVCTCNPQTETRYDPCPAGYSGSIQMQRTFTCSSGYAGSWGGWTPVAGGNTCAPIPPVTCNWNSSTLGQGPYSFPKGVSMEDPCTCGQTDECYYKSGDEYTHYGTCTCE